MRTGENVSPPHLLAAYNLDGFKLIQTSTAKTKEMDLHLWRYFRTLFFQQIAYQDPWCHDTAVLIVEAMSCKSLVSQKAVTWKKERKSFTNKNSQPCCAPLPCIQPQKQRNQKLSWTTTKGKPLLSLESFISTQEVTIRLEDSEDPCSPWRGNRADLL